METKSSIELLFDEMLVAIDAKEHSKVIQIAEEILGAPDSENFGRIPDVHYARVRGYIGIEDFDRAAEAVRFSASALPDDNEITKLDAYVRGFFDDFSGVLEVLASLQEELVQEDQQLLQMRAFARLQTEDPRGSLIDLDNLISKFGVSEKLLGLKSDAEFNLEMVEAAIETRDRAIELSSTDEEKAGHLFSRAYYHFHSDKYEQALQDCNASIECGRKTAGAYLLRALTYSLLGESRLALNDFNQAKMLEDNQDPNFYYYRGLTYGELGEFAKSDDDLSKSIKMGNVISGVRYNRGLSRVRLGNIDGALADFTEEINCETVTNETKFHALYERAMIWDSLELHDKVRADVTAALQIKSDYAPIYMFSALANLRSGQFKAAKADYGKAITLDSELSDVDFERDINQA